MANPMAFLEFPREDPPYRPSEESLRDFREVELPMPEKRLIRQAARCMDCGIPFCQLPGCALQNRVPDWCTLVSNGEWEKALDILHSTDNFPEITGRVCPAPCENQCTLSVSFEPVIIRHIELQIAEYGWKSGWVIPKPPPYNTGEKVAVIGSGPAGLTVAQQLARLGHAVTVYEKEDRIGGGLRYGIPDFILEKHIIDRRMEQMTAEGVKFEVRVNAGVDLSVNYISRSFDAVVLAVGSNNKNRLSVMGRELDGIRYAADFLVQQNQKVAGVAIPDSQKIVVAGKDVSVIGSGYIAEYCIGACFREGARSIRLLEPPSESIDTDSTGCRWNKKVKQKTAVRLVQDERVKRNSDVIVTGFAGKNRQVGAVIVRNPVNEQEALAAASPAGGDHGTEYEIKTDLVLMVSGSSRSDTGNLAGSFSLATDENGSIITDGEGKTSTDGIFATGGCVLGKTSTVDSVNHGRVAAAAVDAYLKRNF